MKWTHTTTSRILGLIWAGFGFWSRISGYEVWEYAFSFIYLTKLFPGMEWCSLKFETCSLRGYLMNLLIFRWGGWDSERGNDQPFRGRTWVDLSFSLLLSTIPYSFWSSLFLLSVNAINILRTDAIYPEIGLWIILNFSKLLRWLSTCHTCTHIYLILKNTDKGKSKWYGMIKISSFFFIL